jgi:hypothetical protein
VFKKRYADLQRPGSFFHESEFIPVKKSTTAKELFDEHPEVFRVDFRTRYEFNFFGKKFVSEYVLEKPTYVCGNVWTLEMMKKYLDPVKNEILISNVEINHWDRVVECRTGNWQPIGEDMVVIAG